MMLVLAGCSSPHSSPADANTATDTNGGADVDGDGVPDSVDVCPDVPDPAQIDLDGDHVGWLCDPLESAVVQGVGTSPGFAAALSGNNFAAVIGPGLSGPRAILGATANLKLNLPGDSSDPMYAWTRSTKLSAPYIDRDGHVWWSIGGEIVGETGLVDLATGAYTKHQDGVLSMDSVAYVEGDLALVSLRDNWYGYGRAIFSPQNGTLVQLDVPAGGVRDQRASSRYLTQTGAPLTFVYPIAASSTGPYSLRSYVPFSAAATDVMLGGVPATNFDGLRGYRELVAGVGLPEVPYCAQQGTTYQYVGVSGTAVSTGILPFTECPYDAEFAAHTLVLTATEPNSTLGVVTVRDGVVHHTLPSLPTSQHVGLHGEDVLVMEAFTTPHMFWAVEPTTGQAVPLTSSLTNTKVTFAGSTVAITGIAPEADGFGNIVTVRYRPTSGVETITVATNISNNTQPIATMTAEGAVVVGTNTFGGMTWIVPAASTTVTELAGTELKGGFVRGNQTVLWAEVGISTTRTVYAYDEVGGTPRLTELATDQAYVKPVGPQWFAIINNSNTMKIARITREANQAPTLDVQATSSDANQLYVWGSTKNGDTVAGVESTLFLLTADTVTKVATGSMLHMYVDRNAQSQPIVGWGGTDSMGQYMCLASHPERCWTIPTSTTGTLFAESTTADGSIAAVMLDVTTTTVYIVRSIGPGTRQQPI